MNFSTAKDISNQPSFEKLNATNQILVEKILSYKEYFEAYQNGLNNKKELSVTRLLHGK